MTTSARARLIVALDVPDERAAWKGVNALRGEVGLFKVGSQLFTFAGPGLVRELVASGEGVFLDLKFHDIPNTVAGAVASALATTAETARFLSGTGEIGLRAPAELEAIVERNAALNGMTDRILVLEDGLVVGRGTHDELLADCTTYQEIVASQLSAEEAA